MSSILAQAYMFLYRDRLRYITVFVPDAELNGETVLLNVSRCTDAQWNKIREEVATWAKSPADIQYVESPVATIYVQTKEGRRTVVLRVTSTYEKSKA